MSTEVIHVELLDAGDVWAPVEAVAEGGGIYTLPTTAPQDQQWALPPGSRVRCERRGDQIVAVALIWRVACQVGVVEFGALALG